MVSKYHLTEGENQSDAFCTLGGQSDLNETTEENDIVYFDPRNIASFSMNNFMYALTRKIDMFVLPLPITGCAPSMEHAQGSSAVAVGTRRSSPCTPCWPPINPCMGLQRPSQGILI